MSLLIACILIYHFGLPWWLYLVAALAFVGKLGALHLWDTTQTENMDSRFNNLSRQLHSQYDEISAVLNAIEGHAKEVRDSCDDIQSNARRAGRTD